MKCMIVSKSSKYELGIRDVKNQVGREIILPITDGNMTHNFEIGQEKIFSEIE